ncbi:MAG TPA: hypothetical protein VGA37_11325 [Gemmatimonadales bacterium]
MPVRAPLVLAWCILGLAGPLDAQQVAFGASVGAVRLTRENQAGKVLLSATSVGVEGAIGVSVVGLGFQYAQGSLRGGTTPDQDLVEGELMVSLRPVRNLAFLFGPHARALVSRLGTERWLLYEGRVRGEAVLVGPVRGRLDVWRVVGSNVNVPEAFDSGYGLDGVLTVTLPSFPLGLSLRYRAERAQLANDTRRESIEHLTLVLGLR